MLIEQMGTMRGVMRGKVVLLTGGGGGIGFEAAKAFAYMGAAVVLAEIDSAKGEAAQAYLNALFPEARCAFYEVDLSEEGQVCEMHRRLTEKYGFIDVLFHNAAMLALGNVEDVPAALWEQCYRVNFKAPLLLTQLFLPEMRRRNAGTVVFVPFRGRALHGGLRGL